MLCRFPLILLLFIISSISISFAKPLDTFLGKIEIEDPLIDSLLNSQGMRRLRQIDQCGINYYFGYTPTSFSRYDHSVGVYSLLKRYKATEKECIAGLLHDVSHTVFSHVGDVLFKEEGYQDNIHAWHLNQMDIGMLLNKEGISVEEILPDNESFQALEQELPQLCADRIEYNLHKAYLFGILDQDAINKILGDLHFENGIWFFTSSTSARQLANLSLYFTEHFYGSPLNLALMTLSAQLLQRGIDIGIINLGDIHFGVDKEVLTKLQGHKDPAIQKLLAQCADIHAHFEISTDDEFDVHAYTKFRGVDPWVMQAGQLQKLTTLDPEYKRDFEHVQKLVAQGVKLRFK